MSGLGLPGKTCGTASPFRSQEGVGPPGSTGPRAGAGRSRAGSTMPELFEAPLTLTTVDHLTSSHLTDLPE